ncbi:hypothetical protein IQ255_02190 [Pleurocapsales cyanobacterium LEGE 10410]|nr:hypothetical protein [Pleurocapsales cyanobacterium LEGE 10410]
MTELSRSDFQQLAEQQGSTCISIYMPAEKAGAETRKNSIRFKNLIREAEEKIEQLQSTTQLNDAVESAKGYIDNYDFWQHQDCGLAFFINADGVKYYRLPQSFAELVEVGDRFYLKPLLPVLTNDNKFYLLALSQNEVRFFLGSHYSISELQLPDSVPVSLAEALKYDDPEKQTQFHTGDAGGSPIYHGQGVGTTDNKDEIKRFFHQIDNGLQAVLQEEKTPMILAGVEYLLPIYQEANSYNNLLETGVIGNPENVDPADLHSQAWKIIEPNLKAAKKQAMEQYYQQSGTGEASSEIAQIVAGAANGQVDTLFITANTQRWGRFEPSTNKVEIHQEATEDSMDLFDFAVTQTYLQQGNVYILEQSEMPENQTMLAILRYPVYSQTSKTTV